MYHLNERIKNIKYELGYIDLENSLILGSMRGNIKVNGKEDKGGKELALLICLWLLDIIEIE